MNIIVPATSFPRSEDDAAGRFVLDLSRGLAERGHHLIHIVPRPLKQLQPPLADHLGIEVRAFPVGVGNWGGALAYGDGMGPNVVRRPWLGMAVPSLIRGLKAGIMDTLRDFPDASLLSHWVFPAGFVAAGIAEQRGLHHVSVAHGGGLQALLRTPVTKRLLRSWARGTQAAVFVSEDLREKARAFLSEAMPASNIVQPMGIDAYRFGPQSADEPGSRNNDGLVLLGVGRLIDLKGFDLLIHAAAELGNARVIICGEGPEQGALEALAARLSVACEFAGQQAPRDLGKKYRHADLLVIPSRLGKSGRSEGSPMVALEAMSQGLGFIASDTGGLPDLAAASQAGRIFKVNESHDLVRAIRDLTVEDHWQQTMKEEALRFAAGHQYSVMAVEVEKLLLLGR